MVFSLVGDDLLAKMLLEISVMNVLLHFRNAAVVLGNLMLDSPRCNAFWGPLSRFDAALLWNSHTYLFRLLYLSFTFVFEACPGLLYSSLDDACISDNGKRSRAPTNHRRLQKIDGILTDAVNVRSDLMNVIRDESFDKRSGKITWKESKALREELKRVYIGPKPFDSSKIEALEARIQRLKGISAIKMGFLENISTSKRLLTKKEKGSVETELKE
ncbi:hypothetical protein U1Q18_049328 [Sarracenia purpurea var. burkii]